MGVRHSPSRWPGVTAGPHDPPSPPDQRANSVEHFKSLTELSSDFSWEQDENFRFTRFAGQTAYQAMVSNNQLLGKTRWEIGALNLSAADWQAHRATLEAHKTFLDLELMRQDINGNPYWSCISGRPVFDQAGNFKGYHGIGRIITERKLAEDQSQRMTFFDALTGLPNQRYLINRLAQARSASSRTHQLGALMFIYLDNFKNINDTAGHQVGDLLLQQVAQQLPTSLREGDTIARVGSDEFVVLLENLGSSALEAARKAEALGKKLLAQFNKPYVLGNQEYATAPSVGLTLIDAMQSGSPDALAPRADTAQYPAKNAGENQVRFFDPQLQFAVDQRAAMELDMDLGIERGQFILHYQPKVNAGRRITGVEALIRWNHPQRGMIYPRGFIAIAEETDLILRLGNWVLESACRQLAAWSAHPDTADLTIAVNISVRQMHDAGFLEQVVGVVRASGANPKRLRMEITESLLLDHVEDTIAKMAHLKTLGVGFSLDDFGTGYSSLSRIKRLPLDQLKIDQTFVANMLTDAGDATVVRAILSLGNSLGLDVIAEGVETQEQLDFLAKNGCGAYQGYFFGRPAPIKDLKQIPP